MILSKLQELEHFMLQRELDREMQELVIRHPEAAQADPEVMRRAAERFRLGGVSLTEAYRLARSHTGTPAVGGAAGLSPEERKFARMYGMTEEDFVKYRQRAEKEE